MHITGTSTFAQCLPYIKNKNMHTRFHTRFHTHIHTHTHTHTHTTYPFINPQNEQINENLYCLSLNLSSIPLVTNLVKYMMSCDTDTLKQRTKTVQIYLLKYSQSLTLLEI